MATASPSSRPTSCALPARLGALLGLDRASLWQGLRLALAAWLAFAAAAVLGLPNAFWAAMPVWVVAQGSRGLLVERGLWRLAGTLAGAAAGFALLAVLPGAVPQLAALGLWVGLCAAGTHLVRGVAAYGVMLAGMTAAVVILPAVLMPEHATELALSRVYCTLIGVAMVTVVTGLFTPPAPRQRFEQELIALAREIAGLDAPPDAAREHAWLAAIHRLEAGIATVAAGTGRARALRRRIETVLQAAVAALAAWQVLAARAGGAAPDPDPASVDPARAHLARAQATLAQAAGILGGRVPAAAGHAPLAPYRDLTRARHAGLLSGAATLAAALLGLLWPGPEGELAALGVCIFSMVLGSLPQPHAVAPKLLAGVCAGMALATAYRFWVQPYASTGLLPLLGTLVPFVLAGGLARASRRPWIALPALDANMCFMLASQAGLPPAGAAAIWHGSLALVLAAAVAALGALALREPPRRHADEALRALRAGVQARLAARPADGALAEAAAWRPLGMRQALRLAAHGPSSPAGREGPGAPVPSPLALFNLGQAVVDLQARLAAPEVPLPARQALALALAALRERQDGATARRLRALAAQAGGEDAATGRLIGDAAGVLERLRAEA